MWKVTIVLDDYTVMGSLFKILGAATQNAYLPMLSLVLGVKSCCEIELHIVFIGAPTTTARAG